MVVVMMISDDTATWQEMHDAVYSLCFIGIRRGVQVA